MFFFLLHWRNVLECTRTFPINGLCTYSSEKSCTSFATSKSTYVIQTLFQSLLLENQYLSANRHTVNLLALNHRDSSTAPNPTAMSIFKWVWAQKKIDIISILYFKLFCSEITPWTYYKL